MSIMRSLLLYSLLLFSLFIVAEARFNMSCVYEEMHSWDGFSVCKDVDASISWSFGSKTVLGRMHIDSHKAIANVVNYDQQQDMVISTLDPYKTLQALRDLKDAGSYFMNQYKTNTQLQININTQIFTILSGLNDLVLQTAYVSVNFTMLESRFIQFQMDVIEPTLSQLTYDVLTGYVPKNQQTTDMSFLTMDVTFDMSDKPDSLVRPCGFETFTSQKLWRRFRLQVYCAPSIGRLTFDSMLSSACIPIMSEYRAVYPLHSPTNANLIALRYKCRQMTVDSEGIARCPQTNGGNGGTIVISSKEAKTGKGTLGDDLIHPYESFWDTWFACVGTVFSDAKDDECQSFVSFMWPMPMLSSPDQVEGFFPLSTFLLDKKWVDNLDLTLFKVVANNQSALGDKAPNQFAFGDPGAYYDCSSPDPYWRMNRAPFKPAKDMFSGIRRILDGKSFFSSLVADYSVSRIPPSGRGSLPLIKERRLDSVLYKFQRSLRIPQGNARCSRYQLASQVTQAPGYEPTEKCPIRFDYCVTENNEVSSIPVVNGEALSECYESGPTFPAVPDLECKEVVSRNHICGLLGNVRPFNKTLDFSSQVWVSSLDQSSGCDSMRAAERPEGSGRFEMISPSGKVCSIQDLSELKISFKRNITGPDLSSIIDPLTLLREKSVEIDQKISAGEALNAELQSNLDKLIDKYALIDLNITISVYNINAAMQAMEERINKRIDSSALNTLVKALSSIPTPSLPDFNPFSNMRDFLSALLYVFWVVVVIVCIWFFWPVISKCKKPVVHRDRIETSFHENDIDDLVAMLYDHLATHRMERERLANLLQAHYEAERQSKAKVKDTIMAAGAAALHAAKQVELSVEESFKSLEDKMKDMTRKDCPSKACRGVRYVFCCLCCKRKYVDQDDVREADSRGRIASVYADDIFGQDVVAGTSNCWWKFWKCYHRRETIEAIKGKTLSQFDTLASQTRLLSFSLVPDSMRALSSKLVSQGLVHNKDLLHLSESMIDSVMTSSGSFVGSMEVTYQRAFNLATSFKAVKEYDFLYFLTKIVHDKKLKATERAEPVEGSRFVFVPHQSASPTLDAKDRELNRRKADEYKKLQKSKEEEYFESPLTSIELASYNKTDTVTCVERDGKFLKWVETFASSNNVIYNKLSEAISSGSSQTSVEVGDSFLLEDPMTGSRLRFIMKSEKLGFILS